MTVATQDFQDNEGHCYILGEEVSRRVYEYFEAKNSALRKAQAWEENVLAALEGLPDNTTVDAIKILRERAGV